MFQFGRVRAEEKEREEESKLYSGCGLRVVAQENTLIAVSFRSFRFAICVCAGQMADKQAQQIMEKYAKNCYEA